MLAGVVDWRDAIVHDDRYPESLSILLAGPSPPNPADLIESARMVHLQKEATEEFNLVVVDTPPTSLVSDAIPLIKRVSGVIAVVRVGRSTQTGIVQLREQLRNLEVPVLLVVANAASDPGRHDRGYAYEAQLNSVGT